MTSIIEKKHNESQFLAVSDYHITNPSWRQKTLSTENLFWKRKLSIETLVKEVKPVLLEITQFEHCEKSLLINIFGILNCQVPDASSNTNNNTLDWIFGKKGSHRMHIFRPIALLMIPFRRMEARFQTFEKFSKFWIFLISAKNPQFRGENIYFWSNIISYAFHSKFATFNNF